MAYIPNEHDFQTIAKERVKSQFDEYNKSKLIDRNKVEQQFSSLAYSSPSFCDNYVIVRKGEVA